MNTLHVSPLTFLSRFDLKLIIVPVFVYAALFAALYTLSGAFNRPSSHAESPKGLTSQGPTYDFTQMNQWHLFGLALNKELKENTDSSIKLVGIIYKQDKSQAILIVDDKELLLKEGDSIKERYTIKSIERQRIILSGQNGHEALEMFPKVGNGQSITPSALSIQTAPKNSSNPALQPGGMNFDTLQQKMQNYKETDKDGANKMFNFRGNARNRN